MAKIKPKHNIYVDVAERAFWTFVQTFLAAVTVLNASALKTAGAAGVAAAIAVVKGFAASRIGGDSTAAALPGSLT